MTDRTLLITGATGLVGGEVAQHAVETGWNTRAIVRATSRAQPLRDIGVECFVADFADPTSFHAACEGVTHVMHAAAKVGDWGPHETYLKTNVGGTRNLLKALNDVVGWDHLERFVQISSLGVYPAHDHHGTDETAPRADGGIDGYTRSKIESEDVVTEANVAGLKGVILRPGFVYGPADQTVIPKLLQRIRDGKFAYLGSGDQLMNNISVVNLREAIFAALTLPYEQVVAEGPQLNLTDPRLVTKREFIGSIAEGAGLKPPSKHVPLGVARGLARVLETIWRWRGREEGPLLSQARIKFLGLNLDFCSDRAKRTLNYAPNLDFADAMRETMVAVTDSEEKR